MADDPLVLAKLEEVRPDMNELIAKIREGLERPQAASAMIYVSTYFIGVTAGLMRRVAKDNGHERAEDTAHWVGLVTDLVSASAEKQRN